MNSTCKCKICLSSSASISELKKNPAALLNDAEGAPIAILNHNISAAYFVSAETYEWLMDKLEDFELAQMVRERLHEKAEAVEMNLNDL